MAVRRMWKIRFKRRLLLTALPSVIIFIGVVQLFGSLARPAIAGSVSDEARYAEMEEDGDRGEWGTWCTPFVREQREDIDTRGEKIRAIHIWHQFEGSVEIRDAADVTESRHVTVNVKMAADSEEKLNEVIVSRSIYDVGSGVVVLLRLDQLARTDRPSSSMGLIAAGCLALLVLLLSVFLGGWLCNRQLRPRFVEDEQREGEEERDLPPNRFVSLAAPPRRISLDGGRRPTFLGHESRDDADDGNDVDPRRAVRFQTNVDPRSSSIHQTAAQTSSPSRTSHPTSDVIERLSRPRGSLVTGSFDRVALPPARPPRLAGIDPSRTDYPLPQVPRGAGNGGGGGGGSVGAPGVGLYNATVVLVSAVAVVSLTTTTAFANCRISTSVDVIVNVPTTILFDDVRIYFDERHRNPVITDHWATANRTRLKTFDLPRQQLVTDRSPLSSPCASMAASDSCFTSFVLAPTSSHTSSSRSSSSSSSSSLCSDILDQREDDALSCNGVCPRGYGLENGICIETNFDSQTLPDDVIDNVIVDDQERFRHKNAFFCEDATMYEAFQRRCINVAHPLLITANQSLSEFIKSASLTEPLPANKRRKKLKVDQSYNVFIENLHTTKKLETTYYVTDYKQLTDFFWYRPSGIRVNIGLQNINVIPVYEDVDHRSDNEFMLGNPNTVEEKEMFRDITQNHCRNPIPDYYSLTLEISKDRATRTWMDWCTAEDYDVGACSDGTMIDEQYLRHTLNEPCQNMGSFPDVLKPAANSIVCSDGNDLLRELFNLTPSAVRPITFPADFCKTAIGRCQQCFNDHQCQLKTAAARHCCEIDCYTSSDCRTAHTKQCRNAPVECAMGDAYRYTLQPIFRDVSRSFQCHVRRRAPDVLYQLWFYLTVPSTDFETPRVSATVLDTSEDARKDTKEDERRGGSTRFLHEIPHRSNRGHEYNIHVNRSHRGIHDSHRRRHAVKKDGGRFQFEFVTVEHSSGMEQRGGGSDEQLILIGRRDGTTAVEAGKWNYTVRSVKSDAVKGGFRNASEISTAHAISNNVFVLSTEFSEPFGYSTSTWVDGNRCNKDVKRFRPTSVAQANVGGEREVNVVTQTASGEGGPSGGNDASGRNAYEYVVKAVDSPPHVKLYVPANTSLLRWWFVDKLAALITDESLIVKLVGDQKNWEILIQGRMTDCPGYISIVVNDRQEMEEIVRCDALVSCPPVFNVSLVVSNWAATNEKSFDIVFDDAKTSYHVFVTSLFIAAEPAVPSISLSSASSSLSSYKSNASGHSTPLTTPVAAVSSLRSWLVPVLSVMSVILTLSATVILPACCHRGGHSSPPPILLPPPSHLISGTAAPRQQNGRPKVGSKHSPRSAILEKHLLRSPGFSSLSKRRRCTICAYVIIQLLYALTFTFSIIYTLISTLLMDDSVLEAIRSLRIDRDERVSGIDGDIIISPRQRAVIEAKHWDAEMDRVAHATRSMQRACDRYMEELAEQLATPIYSRVHHAPDDAYIATLLRITNNYQKIAAKFANDYRHRVDARVSPLMKRFRIFVEKTLRSDWLLNARDHWEGRRGDDFSDPLVTMDDVLESRNADSQTVSRDAAEFAQFIEVHEVDDVRLWSRQFFERFEHSFNKTISAFDEIYQLRRRIQHRVQCAPHQNDDDVTRAHRLLAGNTLYYHLDSFRYFSSDSSRVLRTSSSSSSLLRREVHEDSRILNNVPLQLRRKQKRHRKADNGNPTRSLRQSSHTRPKRHKLTSSEGIRAPRSVKGKGGTWPNDEYDVIIRWDFLRLVFSCLDVLLTLYRLTRLHNMLRRLCSRTDFLYFRSKLRPHCLLPPAKSSNMEYVTTGNTTIMMPVHKILRDSADSESPLVLTELDKNEELNEGSGCNGNAIVYGEAAILRNEYQFIGQKTTAVETYSNKSSDALVNSSSLPRQPCITSLRKSSPHFLHNISFSEQTDSMVLRQTLRNFWRRFHTARMATKFAFFMLAISLSLRFSAWRALSTPGMTAVLRHTLVGKWPQGAAFHWDNDDERRWVDVGAEAYVHRVEDPSGSGTIGFSSRLKAETEKMVERLTRMYSAQARTELAHLQILHSVIEQDKQRLGAHFRERNAPCSEMSETGLGEEVDGMNGNETKGCSSQESAPFHTPLPPSWIIVPCHFMPISLRPISVVALDQTTTSVTSVLTAPTAILQLINTFTDLALLIIAISVIVWSFELLVMSSDGFEVAAQRERPAAQYSSLRPTTSIRQEEGKTTDCANTYATVKRSDMDGSRTLACNSSTSSSIITVNATRSNGPMTDYCCPQVRHVTRTSIGGTAVTSRTALPNYVGNGIDSNMRFADGQPASSGSLLRRYASVIDNDRQTVGEDCEQLSTPSPVSLPLPPPPPSNEMSSGSGRHVSVTPPVHFSETKV